MSTHNGKTRVLHKLKSLTNSKVRAVRQLIITNHRGMSPVFGLHRFVGHRRVARQQTCRHSGGEGHQRSCREDVATLICQPGRRITDALRHSNAG